jgi:predicted DNA-binding antitoxin AbrB/MazE fold protein
MKGSNMTRKVKARFSNGTLLPLEPVDLKEGDEVTVSIERIPSSEEALRALRASAGGWEGLHDPEEFKRMIYQARIDGSRHTPKP